MTRPLVLLGGRVIDPSRDLDQPADVLIQDGKIAGLGASLGTPDGAEVRDVRGKVVAPGLVDVHVHLREPGNEDVETIATGARAAGGVMHEGLVATRLGLKGMPPAAEEIMVGRDILLAGLTGGHVHLCHVSTRGSVELIRRAKEQGIHVTAEATPHHLTLTDRACEGYDTHAKMNPPLREGADVAALRAALAEGVIDCIASDHAPHAYDATEAAFDDAPF